jgi:hypothetical protein
VTMVNGLPGLLTSVPVKVARLPISSFSLKERIPSYRDHNSTFPVNRSRWLSVWMVSNSTQGETP